MQDIINKNNKGIKGTKMKISSLERMEQIVSSNPSLSWDGWDVLQRIASPASWAKTDGVFFKGKWYQQKRFEITSDGWEIPNKLVR